MNPHSEPTGDDLKQLSVIARSASDEAIQSHEQFWIASLALAMTTRDSDSISFHAALGQRKTGRATMEAEVEAAQAEKERGRVVPETLMPTMALPSVAPHAVSKSEP